jgi:cysteinyl-tRNA synthetase
VAAVERREAVGRADEILGLDLLKGMEEVVDEDAAAGVRIVSEAAVSDELRASIREKARARGEARKARRFEDADRLRDELTAMGVEMRDLPDGLTECRVSGR